MNIHLRLATEEHLDALIPLVNAYHAFENIQQNEAVVRKAVLPLLGESSLGRIWLMSSHDHVIGYIAICFGYSIEFSGRDAFVDEMFLLEPYRGKGIGRLVLHEVFKSAASLQIKALHLEVGRHNERAQRFYRSMGFEARSKFFLMSRHIVDQAQQPAPADSETRR